MVPQLTMNTGLVSSWLRNRRAARRVASEQVPELPQAVPLVLESSTRDLWLARCPQQVDDSYLGIPMQKLPEDLRVYEHLLWLSRADTVIELGANYGGSALWLRDRLVTHASYGLIGSPRVISVDLDVRNAHYSLVARDRGYDRHITLVAADLLDPALPDRIAAEIAPGARCLVIEDSAHTYDVSLAALNGFARFVSPGSFFVVEDGYVDIEEMRFWSGLPRGVLPAIETWLKSEAGRDFVQRRDLELYGICSNPYGYLQRVAVTTPAEA